MKNTILLFVFLFAVKFYGQTSCQIVVTFTPATCPTCADGIGHVQVTGLCPPYTYTWVPTNANTATILGLPPGGTFTVYVQDGNVGGDTNCCNLQWDTVTITSSTGINQYLNKNDFRIYPIPSANIISLDIQSKLKFEKSIIIIQNTIGQTIKKLPFAKNIDISDLPEGCYFLQVILLSGEKYKAKFLKQ